MNINYRHDDNNLNMSPMCTSMECNEYKTNYDGHIQIIRHKQAAGIQYRHESKEDITGFIPKPIA